MTEKAKKSKKIRPKIQPISAESSRNSDVDEGLGFGDILTGTSSPKDASREETPRSGSASSSTGERPKADGGATPHQSSTQAPHHRPIADLTPKPAPSPWWRCCCRPSGPSAAELLERLDALERRNVELEASVASLTEEKTALEGRLAREKKKKTDAKARRSTFKQKLANMNEQLKEDFGDD